MWKEWRSNLPMYHGLTRSTWKKIFPPPNQLQRQILKAEAIPNQTMSSFHPTEHSTIEPYPNTEPTIILYQTNSPVDPNLWDGNFTPVSLLSVDECLNGDIKNISCSLQRIAIFMKQYLLTNRDINQFPQLMEIGHTTWKFISAIYKAGWNKLLAGENNRSLQQMVASQFNRKSQDSFPSTFSNNHNRVSKIPPPIPPRPSAAMLAKSRHNQGTKTFAQAMKSNTSNILKLREAFFSLSSKKVIEIHNTAFNNNFYSCPKISMTTKSPSQRHVLIPMNEDNKNIILHQADVYIRIINSYFKTCKSDTTIDYIRVAWNDITVTTNKVAAPSNLSIIERYFKGLEDINVDNNLTP